MTTRVQDLAHSLIGGLVGLVVDSRVEAESAFIAAELDDHSISVDIYWGHGDVLHACLVGYRSDRLASECDLRDPLASNLTAIARDLLTPEPAR